MILLFCDSNILTWYLVIHQMNSNNRPLSLAPRALNYLYFYIFDVADDAGDKLVITLCVCALYIGLYAIKEIQASITLIETPRVLDQNE